MYDFECNSIHIISIRESGFHMPSILSQLTRVWFSAVAAGHEVLVYMVPVNDFKKLKIRH